MYFIRFHYMLGSNQYLGMKDSKFLPLVILLISSCNTYIALQSNASVTVQ